MLGAILGDIVGLRYEHAPIKTKQFLTDELWAVVDTFLKRYGIPRSPAP